MADELLRRAARAITDLHRLATALNDAGYPRDALRLQGFAGLLKGLEGELVEAQTKLDAELIEDLPVTCRFEDDQHQDRKPSRRLRISTGAHL